LILELPMFSIIPEDTLSELRILFGESVAALGKDELTILAACQIEGEITNSRLQYMIDKHKTDITKILQDLCKNKYLVSENKSRWTTYHLNGNFHTNMDSSSANMDSSNPNLGTSNPNLGTSNPNLGTSNLNLGTSTNKIVDKPKKLSRDQIFEIATILNRSGSYIKNHILPPMIEKRLLTREYPDTINHPNQKFKTKHEAKI
jgi:ATP-dependent DNA helicase RecG